MDVQERQVDDTVTAEKQKLRGCSRSTHCLTSLHLIYLLVENYGDPSGELWSMVNTGTEKEDDQIAKKSSEDMGSLLLFVSCESSFYTCSMPELKR